MCHTRKKKTDILGDKKAYEELFKAQNAWISYLLKRLGVSDLRVKKDEISMNIGSADISARSEGDEYVIEIMTKSSDSDEDGEAHKE